MMQQSLITRAAKVLGRVFTNRSSIRGWAQAPRAKKLHYFNGPYSLCGGWLRAEAQYQGPGAQSCLCMTCLWELAKRND